MLTFSPSEDSLLILADLAFVMVESELSLEGSRVGAWLLTDGLLESHWHAQS
jgi:hypothetical protein